MAQLLPDKTASAAERTGAWLDANQHRFDLSVQFLGDEPNARRKPWADAELRWCLVAAWPYEAAAGNSSIPAVYAAINDSTVGNYLCDRFYLPNTPRDLKLLEKAGIGCFGIETRRPLAAFDVVGSSISYPVLSMSYVKQLTMSGIPARRTEREHHPEQWPMIIAGGQSYGAPEMLAEVVDCWWLGEIEDEPGNPGISDVCRRIAALKHHGRWHTDRAGCYATLARQFGFLYFPRYLDVHYGYEDRGLPHPSKQVVGYSGNLPGMRLPLRRRIVKNLDNAAPLTAPPLLYADPAMGAGDLEVARGCPAWCSFPLAGSEEFVTREGVRRLDEQVGRQFEVWTRHGWRKGTVEAHGSHHVQEIVFRPADRGTRDGSWRASPRARRRVRITATPCHGWPLADGGMTHDLAVGDVVTADMAEHHDRGGLDGYIHGFLFGDGHQRHTAQGIRLPKGSGSFTARLHGSKADMYEAFEQLPVSKDRNGWHRAAGITVSSITRPDWAAGDWVVQGWAPFNLKSWPASDTDAAYLRGFLAGWIRADGSPRRRFTSWTLAAQQHSDHGDVSPLAWLQRHAAAAGWMLVGWRVDDRPTNYGPRTAPLYVFTLVRGVDVHGWKVEAIHAEPEPVEVYCLTVPHVHQFTLASGVATGNCSLSYGQKPYRQRTVDNVLSYAGEFARNMGSVRLAPFSPDFPMYTEKKTLIRRLLEEVCDEVDAPTMRVDDFIADPQFMLLQVNGGMDAVTLGVEGNSQRMRDLVGKGVADADIRQAVEQGIRAGIRRFKLYMISNLPGEDEGDVFGILRLARELADIRDSMNQPTVKIQFSWTPLIIEAGTPFQWFAPTLTNRLLVDVFDQLRDLKIEFKVGAKAEPNKLAFFQLSQRASRDVGAALLDAILTADQACWGGVPRTFAATLDTALRAHGFTNGFDDCFDERGRRDMFGWEHIDAGISRRLLWTTYVQMREFAVNTDSHDYDQQYDDSYHGAEFIPRCDERCQGKKCGACDHDDLKIRQRYLQTRDTDTDLTLLTPIDQTSQAQRLRVQLEVNGRYRHVQPPHWRFAVRRAALRALNRLGWDTAVAKRSIRFASDQVKGTDHAAGLDYAEFALTRRLEPEQITTLLAEMNTDLAGWLTLGAYRQHPVNAPTLRADVARMLYEIDTDLPPHALAARLAHWRTGQPVPLRLPAVGGYFTGDHDTVDAHTLISDVWPARHGTIPVLRILTHPRVPVHNLYAALTAARTPLAVAHLNARRLQVYLPHDPYQQDNTRPSCAGCAQTIPTTILGDPDDPDRCRRCADTHTGHLLTEADAR